MIRPMGRSAASSKVAGRSCCVGLQRTPRRRRPLLNHVDQHAQRRASGGAAPATPVGRSASYPEGIAGLPAESDPDSGPPEIVVAELDAECVADFLFRQ